MMKKKLLLLSMLPLLIISVLSTLSVNIVEVSAPVSPVIKIVPEITVDKTATWHNISIYTDYTNATADVVWGYEFTLTYNPLVLNIVNIENGDLIANSTGVTSARFKPGTIDNTAGKLSVTSAFFYFTAPPADVTDGPGFLAHVDFEVVGTGDSDITLGPETKLKGMVASTGEEFNIIDDITPYKGHILNGYFGNTKPEHDVAITSVSANETSVLSGEPVEVTVVAANQGNVTEKFDVTAYYSTTPIGTQTVTLGGSTSQALYFIWDTTPARGNITVSAEANTVGSIYYPEDTTDNTLSNGIVIVNPPILAVDPAEVIDTTLLTGTFDVNITITNAYDLYKAVFKLTWIDTVLGPTISKGDFLEGTGVTTVFSIIDSGTGYAVINYSRTGAVPGVTGSGVLAKITFQVKTKGGSPIALNPYPSWWTTYWKTTPVVVSGVFSNFYDVQAWGISVTGVDGQINVYPTWTAPYVIKVTPRNNGYLYISFNVSAYADDAIVYTWIETLEGKAGAPLNTRTFTVYWDITGASWGLYTIKFNLTDVDPEDNTPGNNELVYGTMKVKIPGDVDGDGDVDPDDFYIFSGKYGTEKGEMAYDMQSDMDGDGDVDPDDFYVFAGKYGTTTTYT